MTDPEILVVLTDTIFSISELQAFLDTARSIPGMERDGRVVVEHKVGSDPTLYTSTACTGYGSKE